MEWFYDDVGKGCDHVIIQEPTGLGIFRWSQDFVIEVSNGSWQGKHAIDSAFNNFSSCFDDASSFLK